MVRKHKGVRRCRCAYILCAWALLRRRCGHLRPSSLPRRCRKRDAALTDVEYDAVMSYFGMHHAAASKDNLQYIRAPFIGNSIYTTNSWFVVRQNPSRLLFFVCCVLHEFQAGANRYLNGVCFLLSFFLICFVLFFMCFRRRMCR